MRSRWLNIGLIVYLQNISIPTPRKVNGNSKGGGGFQKFNYLKESIALKWNFQRGWGRGVQAK